MTTTGSGTNLSYFLTHLHGEGDPPGHTTSFDELLQELDHADEEHPDVSVSHGSGWTLSAFRDGRVILEDVEDSSILPQHIKHLSRPEIIALMELLAAGNIEDMRTGAWCPGY